MHEISPTAISRQGDAALLWEHTEIHSNVGSSVLWKMGAPDQRWVSRLKHSQFVKITSFWKHIGRRVGHLCLLCAKRTTDNRLLHASFNSFVTSVLEVRAAMLEGCFGSDFSHLLLITTSAHRRN
jgi:hypothetical protein